MNADLKFYTDLLPYLEQDIKFGGYHQNDEIYQIMIEWFRDREIDPIRLVSKKKAMSQYKMEMELYLSGFYEKYKVK